MNQETISFDDGRVSLLRWDAAGPDAPLLHIAHATGLNARTYRQLGDRLSDRFRIIASDFRGHGFTTLPAEPANLTSWSRYEQDLKRVLAHLGEPAFLVGHSMGATVSLMLAANNPGLVRGLALFDPALVPQAEVAAWEAKDAAGVVRDSEIARVAAKRRSAWPSRADIAAAYKGRGMFAWWQEGMLEDYLDGGLRQLADGSVELTCAPAWEAATFNAVATSVWHLAALYHGPVAFMRADIQSTFSAESAEQMQKLLPQAQISHNQGRSHFLPMEDLDGAERFIATQFARMDEQQAA